MECIKFTRDFYRLVNLRSESTPSLQSQIDSEESSSSNKGQCGEPSPTPSEAGRAQVQSCSSSDSGDFRLANDIVIVDPKGNELLVEQSDEDCSDVKSSSCCTDSTVLYNGDTKVAGFRQGTSRLWRRSNGWMHVTNGQSKVGTSLPSLDDHDLKHTIFFI